MINIIGIYRRYEYLFIILLFFSRYALLLNIHTEIINTATSNSGNKYGTPNNNNIWITAEKNESIIMTE